MRSKLTPWEMLKVAPHLVSEGHQGCVYFSSFDPYVESFFLKRLRDFFEDKNRDLMILFGGELSRDWVVENLQQVGLFSSQESFLILCADEMSEDVKKAIAEKELSLESRSLFLCAWKKSESLEKLAKKIKSDVIKIQPPAFWESDKLLDYICDELSFPLSYPVQTYLLESLEPTPSEFSQAIKLLKLHDSKEVPLDIAKVQELIKPSRLDRFELAAHFGLKKKNFFQKLLDLEPTDKELIEFFRFMQGHLLKMLDTSYTEGKNKLTKYDRSLMAHSKQWKPEQLKKAIHYFSELELMAKRKERKLKERMRQSQLAQYL